jgi:hypothetical protein
VLKNYGKILASGRAKMARNHRDDLQQPIFTSRSSNLICRIYPVEDLLHSLARASSLRNSTSGKPSCITPQLARIAVLTFPKIAPGPRTRAC